MNNLKNIRESKGLSLKDIGDFIGSSKSYIWEIESGKSMPSISKAYAICKVLGHRIEDVFPDPNKYKMLSQVIVDKSK